jgi:serine/threonine protein kinase
MIDARTDLYQLGVVTAEMLSGQRLFPGESMSRPRDLAETRALMERHLPDCPPRLSDLVARLCSPDPGARPASAQHALSELEELRARVDGPSLREVMRDRAPPGTIPPERTLVREPRSPIPAIAGALLLVTAVVALAVYLVLTR